VDFGHVCVYAVVTCEPFHIGFVGMNVKDGDRTVAPSIHRSARKLPSQVDRRRTIDHAVAVLA